MSGGLDSCVTAAVARANYDLYGLHANYGQRTANRELEAFEGQSDFFSVKGRLVVNLGYFPQIGGSSLTDSKIDVPKGNLDDRNIPNTYVPFRNAHFLSIAVSWAEVIGAEKIFIGAVAEDSSGYPDCREEYYDAMNALIEVGTRPETNIEVVAPLIRLKKSEIVQKGFDLGAPLDKTWSCYRHEGAACGTCDSCLLRLRAFDEARLTDPIPYETARPQFAGVK
jgi:7-cyano-7-deazaguanine synthase